MRHVPQYDNAYKKMGRWVIDTLLFFLLVVAGLAFLANCTGTGAPDSPPSTGRLDLGIVSGALFAQTFDVESGDSDATGACCYEKPRPDGTFIVECSSNRTEDWCEDRQNSTWSEGLSCDEVSCPPTPEGSCCFDCEPGSGGEDTCEDATTEPWCDEGGGRWEVNTLCGEREDCQDECPVPRGSCCVECEVGSGTGDECEDGVVQAACDDDGGSWVAGVECEERENCTDFCVEPLGAVCVPDGFPPSDNPNPEVEVCVDEISFDQCTFLFDDEYCGLFWQVGKTCDDIVCGDPVPTMPWWGYALLPVILTPGAWWLMRRSLQHGRWLPR